MIGQTNCFKKITNFSQFFPKNLAQTLNHPTTTVNLKSKLSPKKSLYQTPKKHYKFNHIKTERQPTTSVAAFYSSRASGSDNGQQEEAKILFVRLLKSIMKSGRCFWSHTTPSPLGSLRRARSAVGGSGASRNRRMNLAPHAAMASKDYIRWLQRHTNGDLTRFLYIFFYVPNHRGTTI